jgi:hypothetical protein
MTKPKTQAQLDRATDLRLMKTYGVGLDWYNKQFTKQNYGCAICASGPGTRRLHVDHDHAWKKVKIAASKISEKNSLSGTIWEACAEYLGKSYYDTGDTKSLAIRTIKRQLLRDSVRGLLCYTCNAGLQKFADNPERLRAAADYLARHQSPDNGQYEYCDMCDGTGLMEGWMRRDGFSCPRCKGKAVVQKGTQ